MTKLTSITAAEAGWKAIFGSGDDETQSRIVAWGLTADGEAVGLIVHPDERKTVVAATDVTLPDGSSFDRYGFRPA